MGGLNLQSNEDGLRHLFEPFGTVEEVQIVLDRDTGGSRGIGFVSMSTAEEAESALSALNETDFDGRRIRVEYGRG